ncbi:unnamed protein product [Camellia sinensis]
MDNVKFYSGRYHMYLTLKIDKRWGRTINTFLFLTFITKCVVLITYPLVLPVFLATTMTRKNNMTQ